MAGSYPWLGVGSLACIIAGVLACRSGEAPPRAEADRATSDPLPPDAPPAPPAEEPERIEAVADCSALELRAEGSDADLALLPSLCPGVKLEHGELRKLILAAPSAAQAHLLIPALDREAELQGIVRLATGDRAGQALPEQLPDPATALLTPIDDRLLAAVELAHEQLRLEQLEETQRTLAHALLARVHFEALQALGLRAGRPLPPFARLLAGPALFHGRSFCRFYWQRRVAGLERLFAETELALLTLLLDLDNTPHASDTALLAIERERTRRYLLREGPSKRIAARARSRPDARALGTELLQPFVQELDRLFDHGFIDLALDRALQAGAAAGGYGLDPMIAVLTEDLRARDLREYERRLARRVERARQRTPRSRQGDGPKAVAGELPVEWAPPAQIADEARAWLAVAHGRGPDFARRHALARAMQALETRPDALLELLGREDAVVAEHAALLRTMLDARDDGSLAYLRARMGPQRDANDERDAHRRTFALATRDALLHPR